MQVPTTLQLLADLALNIAGSKAVMLQLKGLKIVEIGSTVCCRGVSAWASLQILSFAKWRIF